VNWGRDIHNEPTVDAFGNPVRKQVRFDGSSATRSILVLCLDTSGSMWSSISQLNEALQNWVNGLANDLLYRNSVEIALVTFGNGGVVLWRGPNRLSYRDGDPFLLAREFHPPSLDADGRTPMLEALRISMSIISARKKTLRQNGRNWYRPLLWLVTDGEPDPGGSRELGISPMHRITNG
jgi:uncharacterized protein YegL